MITSIFKAVSDVIYRESDSLTTRERLELLSRLLRLASLVSGLRARALRIVAAVPGEVGGIIESVRRIVTGIRLRRAPVTEVSFLL